MGAELLRRIDEIDDKTACLVVKVLTQELAKGAPADKSDRTNIGNELDRLVKDAGVAGKLPHDQESWRKTLSPGESATVSRALLKALAAQPGGDRVVEGALQNYRDTSLDFGVLSVGMAAGFLYLAVVGEFDITIAGSRFTKKGLDAAQQVKLAKSLLPDFLKSLLGIGRAKGGQAGS
jgi:hypothetical protein